MALFVVPPVQHADVQEIHFYVIVLLFQIILSGVVMADTLVDIFAIGTRVVAVVFVIIE